MTDAQRLAEAKAAYHDLVTGTLARVFVDQNGERVEYVATKKADLAEYIRTLEGLSTGATTQYPTPLRFVF